MKRFDGTPIATILNANGIAFTMRLVRKGDGYGRELATIHEENRPLVEFYDARRGCDRDKEKGGEYGEFVSRYYLETLRRGETTRGLNLDGGVADWSLDAEAFAAALLILQNWTRAERA